MARNDTLAPLTELIPPPKRPLRAGDDDAWRWLKELVDFPFPELFLEYGRTYGVGEIEAGGYVLMVGNPLDARYAKWAIEQSEVMRLRGDGPDRRDTRFYPEPGGVLPFASDLCGDLTFFTRKGQIATCPGGDPNLLVYYDLDLVQFLCQLFSGELSPEYFPNSEVSRSRPVFRKSGWM